ncbi:CD1247 N-terminal domain-containing protein [Brevibacillus ginsengisoli]|uniref:CD1247 N-terminal domain-containing protein n=1 Tax=Brevibacillus ginsengisoli TaxID=363854 RepID=UPI003CE67143
MDYLEKRISYLRGLADGFEVEESSREGKILTGMIEVMEELTGEVKAIYRRLEETEEYVEAVDEDLNDVELFLFDEDDDLYEDVDEDDMYDVAYSLDDDDDYYNLDDDEGAAVFETECPTCKNHYHAVEYHHPDQSPINPT